MAMVYTYIWVLIKTICVTNLYAKLPVVIVVSCEASRSNIHEHLQAYMTTTVSYLRHGSSKL